MSAINNVDIIIMKILLYCRTYLPNEVVISKSKQDGCSEWSVIHIKYPVISPLPAWERNDLTFEHFVGYNSSMDDTS